MKLFARRLATGMVKVGVGRKKWELSRRNSRREWCAGRCSTLGWRDQQAFVVAEVRTAVVDSIQEAASFSIPFIGGCRLGATVQAGSRAVGRRQSFAAASRYAAGRVVRCLRWRQGGMFRIDDRHKAVVVAVHPQLLCASESGGVVSRDKGDHSGRDWVGFGLACRGRASFNLLTLQAAGRYFKNTGHVMSQH